MTRNLGDSISKNVDGWRLNRRMKFIASVRSISGATIMAMTHYIMGYLEDEFPDAMLLHHGTNDLRNEESAEKIESNIINVVLSAKSKKNTVYVSGLTVRNDKYDRKGNDK